MSIIAKIAECIVVDVPHNVINGAKDILIAPNPMAQPIFAQYQGAMEATLTLQSSTVPMALSILSCLALFGLTIWQIRRAITPREIKI